MKKIFFIILCAGFMNSAFAKDSTWNLCVGDVILYESKVKLVVNVFEHRNPTGNGRVTDLTMIYGQNVLAGKFNSTANDSGVVILKQDKSNFRGSVKVDYAASTIALSGKLNLFGEVSPLVTTLSCTGLEN